MNIVKIGGRSYTWEPNLLEIQKALDYIEVHEQNSFPLNVIDALLNIIAGKTLSNTDLLIKDLLIVERVLKKEEYSLITILTSLEQIANEPYYILYKNVLNRYGNLIFTDQKGETSIASIPIISKVIDQYY